MWYILKQDPNSYSVKLRSSFFQEITEQRQVKKQVPQDLETALTFQGKCK